MSEEQVERITLIDITLSLVTNHVIFPIHVQEMREVLAKNGYELVRLASPLPRMPARIAISGIIARKHDLLVNVDTVRNVLGVGGKSSEEIIESFAELVEVLEHETDAKLEANAKYYEMVAHYHVSSETLPRDLFSRISEGIDLFTSLGEALALGTPVSMFGLRLVPRNMDPNSVEWFDIAIEPDILVPTRYLCGIVFRSASRDSVVEWTANHKNSLSLLMEVIENE